jgi:putative ABC transport system permease protein
VLVNETLARRHWPGADAVGRRIREGGADSKEPWLTVVGIVADTCQSSLTEPIGAEILFSYNQNPVAWHKAATLVVHTRTDPLAVAEGVKREVRTIAPDLPLTDVRSMQQILREEVGEERFAALLLGGFAITALCLAAIGMLLVLLLVSALACAGPARRAARVDPLVVLRDA